MHSACTLVMRRRFSVSARLADSWVSWEWSCVNCLALTALPDVAMDWRAAPPLCAFVLRLAMVFAHDLAAAMWLRYGLLIHRLLIAVPRCAWCYSCKPSTDCGASPDARKKATTSPAPHFPIVIVLNKDEKSSRSNAAGLRCGLANLDQAVQR